MNRETWLNELAKRMAPRFEQLGFPLPKFRVSIGFTSGGKTSNANGECWSSRCSADGHFEIFISIGEGSTAMIAAILCHELTHCAVGLAEGHKGKFVKVLSQMGLAKPWTQSVPTPDFESYIEPFIKEIGPIPHAKLVWRDDRGATLKPWREPPERKAKDVDKDDEVQQKAEPDSSRKPKQTTRLKKVSCNRCGYNVRVTQKWLEVGLPHCPNHGPMELDETETPDE